MANLDDLLTNITPQNVHGESVVHLVPPYVAEHDEQQRAIIEALESWLERAKRGEFEQIALVGTHKDGAISRTWVTFYDNSRLQGALFNLMHRLAEEWNRA